MRIVVCSFILATGAALHAFGQAGPNAGEPERAGPPAVRLENGAETTHQPETLRDVWTAAGLQAPQTIDSKERPAGPNNVTPPDGIRPLKPLPAAPPASDAPAPRAEFDRPTLPRELSMKGNASWYGEEHRGKLMANGARFDPDKLTAASWFFPLGSKVLVTLNSPLQPSQTVVVAITDRGPAPRFVRAGRIIDLSHAAFRQLAPTEQGLAEVKVVAVAQKSYSVEDKGPRSAPEAKPSTELPAN